MPKFYSDGNFSGTSTDLTVDGNISGRSVNSQYSLLYRFGGLFFTWDSDSYGTNNHHSIRSTYGDSFTDSITLNSFNHFRVNIDSNNNNNTSYFEVGDGTTGTSNVKFRVDNQGKTYSKKGYHDLDNSNYYIAPYAPSYNTNNKNALRIRGRIWSDNPAGGAFQLRNQNAKAFGLNPNETGMTVLSNESKSEYITYNSFPVRAATALVLGNTPFGTTAASSGKDIFNITRVNQNASQGSSNAAGATGLGGYRKILNLRGNGDLYLNYTNPGGSVYGSKFISKASTGYYVDPDSSSQLNKLRLDGDEASNNDFLQLHNRSNGNGVQIKFSDQNIDFDSASCQHGTITFKHADTSSFGSGASFVLGSDQSTTTILADGKLMYNEGIYSKPSSGTGAGTRKDENWDTAYSWGDHSEAGYLTSESDTLATVTGRGASTTTSCTFNTITMNTPVVGSSAKIKFQNNDFIRFDDTANRFHFDVDGGTSNASVQAATFVGALSGNASTATNADKLDGLEGTHYLDYNNLTNKPTIPAAGMSLWKISDGSTTDDVEDGETVNIVGGSNIIVEASGDRELEISTNSTINASVLQIDSKKVLDMPNNSTQRGPWNPIATFVRGAGAAIYGDEDFVSGTNSVSVYNNQGGTGVQHFHEEDGTTLGQVAPNSSGKVIRVVNNGNNTSPGRGGFFQTISSANNQTFVQVFQAKLETGKSFEIAENSQGTNKTSYFLTNNAGTGKFEWYVRVSHCGDSGTFSSGGHIYVSGGSANEVFTWYLASSEIYRVTDAQNRKIKAIIATGYMQAPIFYGSNSTYYLDADSTSTSLNVAGGGVFQDAITIDSDGSTDNYYLNFNESGSNRFTIYENANNVYFNGWAGHTIFRPQMSGSGSFAVIQGNNQMSTSGAANFAASVTSPIFYDTDTNYYVDPASTSIVKYLGRKAHQEGLMVGGYNNIGASHAKTNPIFTIGSSYLPNETTLGNMYGIGYTRGDMSAMPGTNGWGMYVAADGDARIFLDAQNGGVGTAQGSWRAPQFIDSDNTGYYIDPASTISLKTVGAWHANSHTWSGEYAGKIQYHSNHWYMQTTSGVLIRNASGTNNITLSADGIGTANASWRAPIFFDSNNTNYFVNPASTSKTSINIIDGRLTIGQSTDAGSTYRLYTAAGGQVYFGGHMNATSATFSGTISNGSQYANLGNINLVAIGNSPIDSGTGGGTGSGSSKLLGYNQLNGSERASATLGVNDQGIVMEYEKIFTFKVTGSGWLNRQSNPYKLIQAPGADKIIVVDEFAVFIDYETRTGISNSGIARVNDTNAYVVGFYKNETGQSTHNSTPYNTSTNSDTAFGITMSGGNEFFTLGVMPRGFMQNSTFDRGYYRDVPVHQSALIPNRSLFWKTARNCTSTSNAPGGAHYIKIKYRVIDISAEFSDNGVNHIIDTSNYDGQFAHLPDLRKDYNDAGQAVQ